MPWHIGVGGAWKQVAGASIGVGGVWKTVQSMYIGVGGVWKEFYTNIAATLTTMGASASHTSACTSTYRVHSSGRIWSSGGIGTLVDRYQWIDAVNPNTAYEVRATYVSGTVPTGTLSTWLACSSVNDWSLNSGTLNVVYSCVLTIEIRMAASPNTVLATQNITIDAERFI